jgi:transposase InsO family protein
VPVGEPARGTQRYQLTQREDEDALTEAIVELASQYGRYGYLRITALLKRDGWRAGKDRVERIWRHEGLKVPQRQKPRGRLWFNVGSCGGCGRSTPPVPMPSPHHPEPLVGNRKPDLRTPPFQCSKLLPQSQIFQEQIAPRIKRSRSHNEQQPQ